MSNHHYSLQYSLSPNFFLLIHKTYICVHKYIRTNIWSKNSIRSKTKNHHSLKKTTVIISYSNTEKDSNGGRNPCMKIDSRNKHYHEYSLVMED